MKASTREWVDKADADLLTATREFAASPPNYDAVAFHAQQFAEKYLKARLVEAGLPFPKTHDLSTLLNLLLPLEPSWEAMRGALDALTSLGVEVRYPGSAADAEDAREALRAARAVRDTVRPRL
jgi:HEPN domain-containing protein